MTTQSTSAPRRKPINFDFEQNRKAAHQQLDGIAMNIAHQLSKIERMEALLEEKGLSAAYFNWETQQLNEDFAQLQERGEA